MSGDHSIFLGLRRDWQAICLAYCSLLSPDLFTAFSNANLGGNPDNSCSTGRTHMHNYKLYRPVMEVKYIDCVKKYQAAGR